jgi:hypothetical protein
MHKKSSRVKENKQNVHGPGSWKAQPTFDWFNGDVKETIGKPKKSINDRRKGKVWPELFI